MLARVRFIFTILFLFLFHGLSLAANTIYTNQYLTVNSYIESPNRQYKLALQSGGLFIYRADGSIRWLAAANGGVMAFMQNDGNFVIYSGNWTPLWSSGSGGHAPNNYTLGLHDDGDILNELNYNKMMYYNIWALGPDPNFANLPTKSGDVVGRDLAVTGLGWLGHIGLYDGDQIFEAFNPSHSGENAIRIVSLADFRSASSYWGKVSPAIPNGILVPACYEYYCHTSNVTQYQVRTGIARRARQVYLIGADYTTTTYVRVAAYADQNRRAVRGQYRCDTFVESIYRFESYYAGQNSKSQTDWYNFVHDRNSGISPAILYERLGKYQ